MEEKKKHPSLPSNYVTLAQLQERWLKEKERKDEEKELQEKQVQQRRLPQENLQQMQQERDRDQHLARQTTQTTQRRGVDSRSATRNQSRKEFRPKILNESETNRSAVEVSSENHEKLEAKAEILGDNADKSSKSNKLKKKKKKKKKKLEAKAEILVDHADKGSKSNKPQKKKKVKRKNSSNKSKDKDREENGTINGTVEAEMEAEKFNLDVEVNDRTAMNNELNHEVVVNVEEKFRDLSMKCESDKHNSRFRRPYSGFYGTRRNYRHSYGGYSWRFARREVPKPSGDKMVWVRKDNVISGGNFAGIETASGSN